MTMDVTSTRPIHRFETALGTCGLRWSEQGITDVAMPRSRALHETAHVESSRMPEMAHDAIARIIALLDGRRCDLRDIVLDESGLDDFRRAVHTATREVGPGETTTYGELARAVGEPAAAREVGAVLGRNPFPIVVPCHRVLAADGALHGFSAPGGVHTKRRMLEIEGAPGFGQRTLFA